MYQTHRGAHLQEKKNKQAHIWHIFLLPFFLLAMNITVQMKTDSHKDHVFFGAMVFFVMMCLVAVAACDCADKRNNDPVSVPLCAATNVRVQRPSTISAGVFTEM